MFSDESNAIHHRFLRVGRVPILVAIMVSMVPVFFVSRSVFKILAQNSETKSKKFTKIDLGKEPVEILAIRTKGGSFKLGESFDSDKDWIEDMSIKIKNITNRKITYINVSLALRKTEQGPFIASDNFVYGVRPLSREKAKDVDRLLLPDTIDIIPLSDLALKNIKFLLADKVRLNELTFGHLTLMMVVFDDGTKWSGGRYWRPDAEDPEKFIEIHTL